MDNSYDFILTRYRTILEFKDIISDIECTDSLRAKLMIEQLRYEKLKLRKEIKEMDYKIQCIKNKFITK